MSKNYYQGKFKANSPEKYLGNTENIVYRSSWELKLMIYLDSNTDIVHWAAEEFAIPYFDPITKKTRRYFPDFYIENKNGEKKVLEVKPFKETKPPAGPPRKTRRFIQESLTYIKNEAKWAAAKKFCDERGWEFVVLTEKELF